MRALSATAAAWAQAETAQRCLVWRITRRDGTALAFTNHDAAFVFQGLTCEPARGLQAGEIVLSDDLSPDSAGVRGGFSSEALTEADLAAGLWDGARVDLFVTAWTDPEGAVCLFSGRLGEVSRTQEAFEAELRGLQAPLSSPAGRTMAQRCDARLGDGRCGKSLTTFTHTGAVTAVIDERTLTVSGFSGLPPGYFDFGEALFANGARRGIRRFALPDLLVLEDPVPPGVAPPAALTLVAGCDKAHATCRDKFANIANFQGFPHMPGTDVLTAGPQGPEPKDGGSRFR